MIEISSRIRNILFLLKKEMWYTRPGFWVSILLIIFIVIWLIWGGQKHEFIGLSGLDPGFSITRLDEKIIPGIKNRISSAPSKLYLDDTDISETSEQTSVMSVTNVTRVTSIPTVPHLSRNRREFPTIPQVGSPRSSNQGPIKGPIQRWNRSIDGTPTLPPGISRYEFSGIDKGDHGSKIEAVCCSIMEEIYGVPFTIIRPNFLKNPETGRNLELDCYNSDLQIALEYNGPTHYIWPNHTTQTLDQFKAQIRRDQYKVEACDSAGVYLITVPYNVPPTREALQTFIEYYLPERVQDRLRHPSIVSSIDIPKECPRG